MTLQIQRSFDREKGAWNITPKGDVDISTAAMLRVPLMKLPGDKSQYYPSF